MCSGEILFPNFFLLILLIFFLYRKKTINISKIQKDKTPAKIFDVNLIFFKNKVKKTKEINWIIKVDKINVIKFILLNQLLHLILLIVYKHPLFIKNHNYNGAWYNLYEIKLEEPKASVTHRGDILWSELKGILAEIQYKVLYCVEDDA